MALSYLCNIIKLKEIWNVLYKNTTTNFVDQIKIY